MMKNLAKNKKPFLFWTLLFLTTVSTIPVKGQTQTIRDEVKAAIEAEIEEHHQREQKAFIEGNCDTVASFYSDEATRYMNGRPITSQEEAKEFCSKIPRPFGGKSARPKINDNFYVLSENIAHFVRTIDFEPADDQSSEFKREVVTKIWKKTKNGWKIVHFHSSVHSVSEE